VFIPVFLEAQMDNNMGMVEQSVEPVCNGLPCNTGFYLDEEYCQCLLSCDHEEVCADGLEWDPITCSCAVRGLKLFEASRLMLFKTFSSLPDAKLISVHVTLNLIQLLANVIANGILKIAKHQEFSARCTVNAIVPFAQTLAEKERFLTSKLACVFEIQMHQQSRLNAYQSQEPKKKWVKTVNFKDSIKINLKENNLFSIAETNDL
jgi:hypothetical protein